MTSFISIRSNIKAATASLDDAAKTQIPFAAARAVTKIAFEVQRAENAAIGSIFNHPRPFTQRAARVTKATKSYAVATVFLRPEVDQYLAPFEFGGRHHLPGAGRILLNPKGVRLDQYGQIRGQPRNIANRANIFVGLVQTKAGPVWGFWQRLSGKKGGPKLKLLARAGEALQVHKSLGFVDRARALVSARARAVFGASLAQAVGTGKP